MRNVKVALALGLLALAGCSSTDTAPFGQSTTTTATTTTTSSAAPTTLSSPGGSTDQAQPTAPITQPSAAPLEGGPTEVPDAQIDHGTLSDTYDPHVSTSADGRTVQVIGTAGGCKTASAEVTAQSGDQVLITLVTTYHVPPSGVACTQELGFVPVNVTLDAPLGSRRVVLETREDTA
ncbi:hypothetical protein AB0G02_21215 [Actinosynnema sp. NPDC023658]|uniref:hypothetical protein n=1 Tax=Actinosynnema sp. NPDC023658 TaxID=3155465 RepID=UPI003406B468